MIEVKISVQKFLSLTSLSRRVSLLLLRDTFAAELRLLLLLSSWSGALFGDITRSVESTDFGLSSSAFDERLPSFDKAISFVAISNFSFFNEFNKS